MLDVPPQREMQMVRHQGHGGECVSLLRRNPEACVSDFLEVLVPGHGNASVGHDQHDVKVVPVAAVRAGVGRLQHGLSVLRGESPEEGLEAGIHVVALLRLARDVLLHNGPGVVAKGAEPDAAAESGGRLVLSEGVLKPALGAVRAESGGHVRAGSEEALDPFAAGLPGVEGQTVGLPRGAAVFDGAVEPVREAGVRVLEPAGPVVVEVVDRADGLGGIDGDARGAHGRNRASTGASPVAGSGAVAGGVCCVSHLGLSGHRRARPGGATIAGHVNATTWPQSNYVASRYCFAWE